MKHAIGIATDSHSSITPDVAKELGVAVLPMPFTIDGQSCFEELTLTREQFYEHQRRGDHIATSQPPIGDVLALWDKMLEEYEDIVYIPISSGLSGACQTATALAEEEPYRGHVYVVDNGRVATPLHVTVLDALHLREAGAKAREIKEKLEQVREDLCIYVAVETLEHLKSGGRISAASALVGSLLHIKPILYFTTGTLSSFKKVRGMGKAQEAMIEAVRNDLETRFADALRLGKVTLLTASSASKEVTEKWIARVREAFPNMPMLNDYLSLGVSCHIGEGGLGVGLSVSP